MILFWSGSTWSPRMPSNPENVFKEKANIMLTFAESYEEPAPRFLSILKMRKRMLKEKESKK